MKVLLSCLVFMLFVTGMSAEAAVNFRLYGNRGEGKILSAACIMSYTDRLGGITRVMRGNPVTIYIR